MQPTGGVILLNDTTPSEPKTLIELKARKNIKAAAAPETLQDRIDAAFTGDDSTARDVSRQAVGASEAAGVLTAVDEDGEGGEEAEVPREFEYHSDGDQEEEG